MGAYAEMGAETGGWDRGLTKHTFQPNFQAPVPVPASVSGADQALVPPPVHASVSGPMLGPDQAFVPPPVDAFASGLIQAPHVRS